MTNPKKQDPSSIKIQTKTVKLSSIKLNKNNPRTITEKEMAYLVKSLQDFPDMMKLREVVVDEEMLCLGGNMRARALQQIGEKTCIVKIVKGLSAEQKREFIVKDNTQFGIFDMDILANEWAGLPLDEWGLDLSPDWFANDKEKEPQDAEPQIDKADELQKEWKTELGQIWEIGKHRLMCGDSTKEKDVERLMGGKKADMVFTDPPYGISIVKTGSVGTTSKSGFVAPNNSPSQLVKARKYTKMLGDDEPFNPSLILGFGFKTVILWGANHYASKLPDKAQWLIWDKKLESGGLDHNNFSDCELAWTNTNGLCAKIYRHTWSGMLRKGKRNDELKDRIHPTQKPVGMCKEVILDFSKNGESIIDFYIGSGTTMVAAEQLNRICYGMEIEPKYIAVTLQRMKDAFPDIEIRRVKK